MIVYDLECFSNLFVAIFYNIKFKTYHTFIISEYEDQREDLLKYLKDNVSNYFVGYNNILYDDQLLHHVNINPNIKLEDIKAFSDKVINTDWGVYPSWQNTTIPKSIDLMQLNNYGKYGKSVSLKQIAFNLKEKSMDDLPLHHNAKVKTKTMIDKVVKYGMKDVDRTYNLLKVSKNLIIFRKELSKNMNIDVITDSEVTLVKKVFAKIFSEEMGISLKEVKALRTYREEIRLADFIPELKFKSKKYRDLYDFYKNLVLKPTIKSKKDPSKKIINTNKSIEYIIEHKNGLVTKYGLGGIHGAKSPRVVYSTEDKVIIDVDFRSFYPHNMWLDKLDPLHLPKGLLGKRLKQWFNQRIDEFPKHINYPMNHALKIILNLTFGQTKSEFSLLYDQAIAVATCVNGMLKMSKITEEALLFGADCFYQNTDGGTFIVDRSRKDEFYILMNNLSKFFNIELEFSEIEKFVMKDVSSILVKDSNGKIKDKGQFERYETIVFQNRLDKNCSHTIIQEALYQYYINNVSIEDTINNCNDILDFCIGVKGSSQFQFVETSNNSETYMREVSEYIDSDIAYKLVETSNKNGILTNQFHGNVRMLRYYVATEGSLLTKFWNEKSKKGETFDSVEATAPVKILMNVSKRDIDDFDKKGNKVTRLRPNGTVFERFPNLNRQWYIDKCNDIIDSIEDPKHKIIEE